VKNIQFNINPNSYNVSLIALDI